MRVRLLILDDYSPDNTAEVGRQLAKVVAALRTTKIHLAFTHQEGFGLTSAEAITCGNYVIGQHGFGGR